LNYPKISIFAYRVAAIINTQNQKPHGYGLLPVEVRRFYFMNKNYISFKEFRKSQLESKQREIISDLEKRDCQKVEFLRGMLSVYSELINETKWEFREEKNYF
jgi:hypothetical protein